MQWSSIRFVEVAPLKEMSGLTQSETQISRLDPAAVLAIQTKMVRTLSHVRAEGGTRTKGKAGRVQKRQPDIFEPTPICAPAWINRHAHKNQQGVTL